MRCERLKFCAAVLLIPLGLWVGLAAWQWHEYGHERELAETMLSRQAESVRIALVGGIRAHRRFGSHFEDMTQAALNELANSEDILAVGIASVDGTSDSAGLELLLFAGNADLLDPSSPVHDVGYRFIDRFHLEPDPGGGSFGRGLGPGRGFGRGLGRGQEPWWEEQFEPGAGQADVASPFSSGGQFASILVLDRSQTDLQCRRAFGLRVSVVLAGGAVLVCLTLFWLATVWLMQARGRARMLELEARHFRDMSQASAGLAHETRNPLGLVRGWIQRLAEPAGQASEQRKQAEAVLEECDRVADRINEFLALARPCEPKPEPVELEPLIAELIALLEPDLEAKELKVEHSVADRPTVVNVDREMFRRALFNLISNAIHFTPEKGTVEIRARAGQDGRARIEVADRGPSVPQESVAMLFSPYFTTRSEGTGLGLAIVRRIAIAHGWEAGYTPRVGGGSIFWLEQIDG